MDVFFWAIAPRVVFWTRFEANFRLGGNRRPLFLNGLTSPRVPGQLLTINRKLHGPCVERTWSETPAWFQAKLSTASNASITLSFSDVSDAHQFFPSPL